MNKSSSKLIMFLVLVTTLFTVGCSSGQNTKEEVYEDFQKKVDKITSYTCTMKVEAISNKESTIYVFKHTYVKPDYYKLEVKFPKNLSGKTIEYKGNKVNIYNKDINDMVELPNINGDSCYLFIGDFINNCIQNKNVILESTENELKIELEIPGDNKYFNKQILYVNNKTKTPDKMEIKDYKGLPRFIVEYEDFQYKK